MKYYTAKYNLIEIYILDYWLVQEEHYLNSRIFARLNRDLLYFTVNKQS